MIELDSDRLEFRFPEVHRDARLSIDFQRTLRVPDDGRDHPPPPGLGRFPLRHLDDFAGHLPEAWRERGGVIAPVHQAEALWIRFEAKYPFAVKVATGKTCAITGNPWMDSLNRDPQDYAVLPEQRRLHGYCVEEGTVRQFVAMPLGTGFTAEEQLTGAAIHGGLQLAAYPMRAARYEEMKESEASRTYRPSTEEVLFQRLHEPHGMGLAPGGQIGQVIRFDERGIEAWDQRHGSRCFVTLLNSLQWTAVTGERPPTSPPTAKDYASSGLPWFGYYGGDKRALAGSRKLRKLASAARHARTAGQGDLPDDKSTTVWDRVRRVGRRMVGE